MADSIVQSVVSFVPVSIVWLWHNLDYCNPWRTFHNCLLVLTSNQIPVNSQTVPMLSQLIMSFLGCMYLHWMSWSLFHWCVSPIWTPLIPVIPPMSFQICSSYPTVQYVQWLGNARPHMPNAVWLLQWHWLQSVAVSQIQTTWYNQSDPWFVSSCQVDSVFVYSDLETTMIHASYFLVFFIEYPTEGLYLHIVCWVISMLF